jgi:hypothetical protein
MHLDIKNGKIWIQINNTELDIGQALVEMGIPKEDIVIGFQPVYIRQVSGYAIAVNGDSKHALSFQRVLSIAKSVCNKTLAP